MLIGDLVQKVVKFGELLFDQGGTDVGRSVFKQFIEVYQGNTAKHLWGDGLSKKRWGHECGICKQKG